MRCHYDVTVLIIYIVTAVLLQIAKSEYFTAVAELEKLLHTEEEIIKTLDKYLQSEEERLDKVKRITKQYAKLHKAAKNNTEIFLSNPVNAYLLVKRLTTDWNATVHLIESSESRTFIKGITSVDFPDQEDLTGAATALIRLQETYLLDTASVAQGHIKGTHSSSELTAADCFELGRQAYEAHYHDYTLLWMQEALKRLDKEEVPSTDRLLVMEYMAYSAYDVGNFTFGLAVTGDIVDQYPGYPRAVHNLNYYQIRASEFETKQASKQNGIQDDNVSKKYLNVSGTMWPYDELLTRYDRLCRGESLKTPEEESKLSCYYTTNNNMFFLLQPVKVEVVNLDPRIDVFYDVISDNESKIIKEVAAPKLLRAVVQNTYTGEIEATTDRISKSTLVEDEEHELLTKLNKRIKDITGLETKSSEPIHVINYGIGGHYQPHFDFALAPDNRELFHQRGNRISTWIFYLSEVPAGGYTVFPIAGVAVKPIKGAAVFWYNLYKNGEGNHNTLHAACPVLAGSKWISNKWLHEVGQEFRRPCSLNPRE